jgi:H+/Cl- antiporter ClcA
MQPLDVSVRSLFTYDASFNHTNLMAETSAYNSSSGEPIAAALAPAVTDEQHVFSSGMLAAYFVFVWAMLLLSYGMAAPTGIFIPCLAAGAAAGRLVGQLLRAVLRGYGILLPVSLLLGCSSLSLWHMLCYLLHQK